MAGHWLPKPIARVQFPDGALHSLSSSGFPGFPWKPNNVEESLQRGYRNGIVPLSSDYKNIRITINEEGGFCDDYEPEKVEGVGVPEASERFLNQRQPEDYREHRERLIRWLLNLEKDPEEEEYWEGETESVRELMQEHEIQV